MNIVFFISPTGKAKRLADSLQNISEKLNHSASIVELGSDKIDNSVFKNSQVIISIGGDGTFLKASHFAIENDIPILGLNAGTLGFLTEAGFAESEQVFCKYLDGEYDIKPRVALECSVKNDDKICFSNFALNEAVVYRSEFTRLLTLSFFINEDYGGTYRADGLIISTPSGSTAYSLSAGGPIVSPDVECMILTAISPHTLSARPLIISIDKVLRIYDKKDSDYMAISLDGHLTYKLSAGDEVFIKKMQKNLKTISFNKDFYATIREKLGWTE